MKIQATKALNYFNGEKIEGEFGTVGKAISAMLVQDKDTSNKMKKYILAQKFYTEDEVTIDSADFEILKSCVERCDTLTTLLTGQVLVYLSSLKEVKEDVET